MSIFNKKKILNDPIYGFINIPEDLIYDIFEHAYFQRLRRIKQLGMTHLVYPSAVHSRFSHALGATYLMNEALLTIRNKGTEITDEEMEATLLAIILHDIGHGPFSHALEYSIVKNVSHEKLSVLFMEELNKEFDGRLTLAITIFKDEYHKHFLHQLVSSQLDVDRMDYLRRDSFFTGVTEGAIGTQRIIKMLDVVDDKIVVEHKGIYSIENFLHSRRIMYWQVYLHKTVLVAEHLLMNILKRAKDVSKEGSEKLFASPPLAYFLNNDIDQTVFDTDDNALRKFAMLDDYDILGAIKIWAFDAKDDVLRDLSRRLIDRRFFRIEFSEKEITPARIKKIQKAVQQQMDISEENLGYYVFTDHTSNYMYSNEEGSIDILFKDGKVKDVAEVSEQLSASKLKRPVRKYFVCYPKTVDLS